jgi:GAF domain-containing protein
VFVSDTAADPLWADYRALALAHDLRACWSTPILSSEGGVLGNVCHLFAAGAADHAEGGKHHRTVHPPG